VGVGVVGVDVSVAVVVWGGLVDVKPGVGVEVYVIVGAVPVQLDNIAVKTKKEMIKDTIATCLIRTPSIQIKKRTSLTPLILHP
jgi:hypothetical protein